MGRKKRRKHKVTVVKGFRIRHMSENSFLVDIRRKGIHERKSFGTFGEAEEYCNQKARLLKNQGLAGFSLSEKERIDAQDALKELEGNATLLEAAQFWNKHNARRCRDATFEDVADAYLENQEKLNRRRASITTARSKYNRLAKTFGDRYIGSITRADLEHWLDGQGMGPGNRNNHLRYIKALFNFAVENDYTENNPANRIKKISKEPILPTIWPAKTVVKVMGAAEEEEPRLAPYLAIGFFAGLRPAELRSLQWKDIELENRIIRVRPEVAKTRRTRLVDISGNLLLWLEAYQTAEPSAVLPVSYTTLRRWRKKVIDRCNIQSWPPDIMRHCFATHYLQKHDIDSTLKQLGHTSANMLYNNYRGLATRNETEKFWNIKPSRDATEKIIKMPRVS